MFQRVILKLEKLHEDWELGQLNDIFKIIYEGGKMHFSIIDSGST